MRAGKIKPTLAGLCWLALLLPIQAGAEVGASAPPPDETAGNGVIYPAREIITMDPARPRTEAVLVAGGRIVATGTLDEVRALAGDATSIDRTFADKVIVPGLIEQHVHPVLSALTLTSEIIAIEDWVLPGRTYPATRSREAYMTRLRQVEAGMRDPQAPLVSWGFHHYFHGKLTRADLDAVSTSRPIVIWHRSGHEFILNTAALGLAGVTREQVARTEQAVREQINFEQGHFWERGALEFLSPHILPLIGKPAQLRAGLELSARYLHAAGVTTAAEPGGVSGFYPQQIAVLGNTASPFRFYFIPDGRSLALEHRGADLLAATEGVQNGAQGHTAFLPRQVKLFSDGAIFSQLMQMEDGYLDGHKGEWMMDKEVFNSAFRTYWDAGYQIHIHQNGDGGLERVLDALEENMRRNPRRDHRTTIVHFGFSSPRQIDRIARLGAIVSANPYYTVALANQYSDFGIGPERANDMVRLGDVSRAGVPFSLHSDMPMAPAQPLFLMWAAVNRTTFSGRTAGPAQTLTVEQALRAVTLDAAYSLRLESEVGSIEPGKRANFTVLEDSPFQVSPQSIKDIRVWGTVLEGRVQPVEP
ncbi:amidohydrolase [Parahaliea mediterranea]|uniref:Amidohydrolase n=1 Tax=Parahaliea mediterranea TaxID=651086 RepID=A0A939DG12_9GAMM|nr:amidohydrolase [Parahaliea mediterranea]MBN7797398.1 amidohydrolase [Parahaliea mediterranea]